MISFKVASLGEKKKGISSRKNSTMHQNQNLKHDKTLKVSFN